MDAAYKQFLCSEIKSRTGMAVFTRQCLPVSLYALSFIKETYPDAYVVIGVISNNSQDLAVADHLLKFILQTEPIFYPPYHAWIDLGQGDIADLTLSATYPDTFTIFQLMAMDRADAHNFGIDYKPVITDPVDIGKFFHLIQHPNRSGVDRQMPYEDTVPESESPVSGRKSKKSSVLDRISSCMRALSDKK